MKSVFASPMACFFVAAISFASPKTNQNAMPASTPRLFLLNGPALAKLRHRIESGELRGPAVEALRQNAQQALKQGPFSVMDKDQSPPSGDKHDFMSMGPYWWPNPKTANGLPYVRRDGQVNPQSRAISDREEVGRMESATNTLALAYYLLGDEAYASHAAKLLEAWFLNPATRMNPNMNFAQFIPGVTEGRGTGLIGTRGFAQIPDDIGLLAGSPAWSAADQKGMQVWFAQYLLWLRNSPNGENEARARNNHGTFYNVQAVSLALCTGQRDLARRLLQEALSGRLPKQIEPDGRQPLELVRTKALDYSIFNLSAWFQLAALGESADVDVWNYRGKNGGSLRKALDFLVPFAAGERPWPYKQIHPFQPESFARLLLIASVKYSDPKYEQLAFKLDPRLKDSIEDRLIAMQ